MKLVHAADLHLDSPLRGLDRYEGAPTDRLRGATRRALENLVDLCLTEQARLLLLAGDLYDGDWKDHSTGLFFCSQMSRLRQAGVAVVMVRGNHDAQSTITKHLPLPDNVRELSTDKPETAVYEELGVAVHGQGFARRAVTADLATGYPEARSGLVNIGLLHTALDGREGHEPYAPTTLSTLLAKGYDYWALGHVHTREHLHERPWVVFPGNPQGRHIRETGPRGAMLLSLSDGRLATVEHRPLDVVRWEHVRVDVSEAETGDAVIDCCRAKLESVLGEVEGRLLAARVVVEGESAAHAALQDDPDGWIAAVRATANDLSGEVWVEKVALETVDRIDLEAVAERDDAIGQLARSLAALRSSDEALAELGEELAELKRKLPAVLARSDGGERLDDVARLREAVQDVERLLIPRLLRRTGDSS